jgi:hypothetical protein
VIEEADQDLKLPLATTQIPVQLIAELARRAGPPPTRRIGLDVMFSNSTGFSSGL